MKPKTRKLTKILKLTGLFLILAVAAAAGINCAVILKTRDRIAGADRVKIVFSEPVRSAAPGQSAVFYDGDDRVIGGIEWFELVFCQLVFER